MSASAGGGSSVWTPSNVITIVRILLVPVFVAALLAPWPEWFGMNATFSNDWKSIVAAGIFVLISCTDWLDGYLARSRGEVTDFGKFMDPLADKILVVAALIALVELGSLPTWVVLIIVAREFVVSGVRMMAATGGVVIAASMIGKFKTVFQMIAIVLFVIKDSHMIGGFDEAIADNFWLFSWAVMLVAVVLTIVSMVDYLVKAREIIGLGKGGAAPAGEASTGEAADGGGEVPDARTAAEGLARQVVELALREGVTVATAESLTGGMIGAALTSVPGSSGAYAGGVVSYTDDVKHAMLGVRRTVLEGPGAVSGEAARQMAEGARERLGADIAVSVTGIAGPSGAEEGKPVGTVWMAVSTELGTSAALHCFAGDRAEVRRQTVECALGALRDRIAAGTRA